MSNALFNASLSTARAPMWRLPETGFALLAAGAATAVAGFAAGASLALAIGGLFTAAILLPPLLATSRHWTERSAIYLATVAGIAFVWLGFISPSRATIGQWLSLVALLASFAALVSAVTICLVSFRLPQTLSAAIATAAAVAWLTWPIWLSPYLIGHNTNQLVDSLVVLHPPLAANGLLIFTVPWTEQAIAYQLTILNQDIPIRLPAGPVPSILAHLALSGLLLTLAAIMDRRRRSQ